jgi:hypothetical protein
MPKVSRQAALPDELAKLYQHLNSCSPCQAANKAADPYHMCQIGLFLTVRAAQGYGNLFKLRRQAHNRKGGCVYACPDLSKHGEAYAVTAPALIVTAIQESLF